MKLGLVIAALVAVAPIAGCAAQSTLPLASGVERISLRPQPPPFCGRCETAAVVVSADGRLVIERGHWAGNYRNWKRRREVRQVTPEQFAAFKGILETYKPSQNTPPGGTACANYISDNDGAIVEWIGGDGRRARVFDFGCLDDRAMNEAVRSAPKALGLVD
jgi:hypothetical protein